MASKKVEVILLYQTIEMIDHPHLSGYIWLVILTNNPKENDGFIKRIITNTNKVKHLQPSEDKKPENPDDSINIHGNQALIISKVNELLNSFGTKSDNQTASELTKYEIDVLQLDVKGLANKEVTDKLCISIHTVISHRKDISEKTGVKSASGLTMYAVLKNIIDIGEITASDLI